MIKFKCGSIKNPETGMTKDIVVKAATPNYLRDILIGGGIVLGGIIYLTTAAFKRGCYESQEAEFRTWMELGLIKDLKD